MTTTETTGTLPVLTYNQRLLLVELLEQTSDQLDAEATRLDREIVARFGDHVIDEEHAVEYDRMNAAADRAAAKAEEAHDLARCLEAARIVTLRHDSDADPVSTITRALVAGWSAGVDVGAVMVEAAAEAQRIVHVATEDWLTSNRPGSWEAGHLEQMLDSSGWDR